MRVLPAGCIFADKGPAAFVQDDDPGSLLALLALTVSEPFRRLVELQLAAADAAARSYEVGVIQRTPVPDLAPVDRDRLAALARRAWSLKRTLDTVNETSHAFLLPSALRPRLGDFDPPTIEAELAAIQVEVDAIAYGLYGFGPADCSVVATGSGPEDGDGAEPDDEDGAAAAPGDTRNDLATWAVGVVFGRFDWRLATGERSAPPEPGPFDPLPPRSPGMLPEGAEPFHTHPGILVDDPGHPHDLAHRVEEVLGRVDQPVAEGVRPWLRRKFFAFHLQRYSKSRRRAPIYWPLSTASGAYTLWLYYLALTAQTLYTAVNDFVEPKLKSISDAARALRAKASRSKAEERELEQAEDLEQELVELRDSLLQIAPSYRPDHDDGVQITAAPLWPLFRHKPWQKVLKDTWKKLEQGDYDWAHLAMNYWPERVRDKCRTDRSLAIAHGLEALYEEPPEQPARKRGRRPAGG